MQGLGQTFEEVLMLVFKVKMQECDVGFLWTPAHVGVEWRETPDRAARLSVCASHYYVLSTLWRGTVGNVSDLGIKTFYLTMVLREGGS